MRVMWETFIFPHGKFSLLANWLHLAFLRLWRAPDFRYMRRNLIWKQKSQIFDLNLLYCSHVISSNQLHLFEMKTVGAVTPSDNNSVSRHPPPANNRDIISRYKSDFTSPTRPFLSSFWFDNEDVHKSSYVYPLNDRFLLVSNAGGKRALTSNMMCVWLHQPSTLVSREHTHSLLK